MYGDWRIYVEASIGRVDQMENLTIVRGTFRPILALVHSLFTRDTLNQ
jgi:hypothetical protein